MNEKDAATAAEMMRHVEALTGLTASRFQASMNTAHAADRVLLLAEETWQRQAAQAMATIEQSRSIMFNALTGRNAA
jgi:hypothetical protein